MDGNNSVDSNNEPRALMGERERKKVKREKHSRKTREKRENEKAEIFF